MIRRFSQPLHPQLSVIPPRHAEAFNQERILEQFLDFMTNRFPSDRIAMPQYLFITGDLAYTGDQKDYDNPKQYSVRKMIDSVARVMGIRDTEYGERVFPVAGNHDVFRKLLGDEDAELANLRRATNKDTLNNLFLGKEKDTRDTRKRILARSRYYCSFLRRLWNRPNDSDEELLWYAKKIPINGNTQFLHVVGMDSAWLCRVLSAGLHEIVRADQYLRLQPVDFA